MIEGFLKTLAYRGSLRAAVTRKIVRNLHFIPYPLRLAIDAVERPHYGYCVFCAAKLASQLGFNRISVIEFGVAGGNGLVNLEYHAAEAKRHLDIDVEVYGFDSGVGLPKPIDYRDQPYHWQGGQFKMDQAKLCERLRFAKVIIGNIAETLSTFLDSHNPARIGAICIDLDYYSSTADAFRLFEKGRAAMMPRVYMYFDDVIGGEGELHSSFTGERLAISEFNKTHQSQKISEAFHLRGEQDYRGFWRENIFIYHDFLHEDYCRFTAFNPAGATSLSLDDRN
jgi:hypothetical protein